MATCACGTTLPGRRQKCDECKGTGRSGASTRTPRAGAKVARPSKSDSAKKAASKPPAKKAAPPKVQVVYPDGLGTRGRQLWKALGFDIDSPGGILALEACRCSDRLERLDSLLAGGESWFDLVEKDEGSGQVVVIINAPLAEARQQQTAFKGMLTELGATRVKGNPGHGGENGKPAPPTPAARTATPIEAARERRRQREQKA